MKKLATAFLVSLGICTLGPITVFAADNHSGDVGLLAGIASLNNSGGSPFTYGLSADFNIDPNWKLGLQFNTMTPNSVTVLGTSYSQSLTNIDAAIKYSMNMWDIGILLGFGMTTTNVPGASNSSNFNYGLMTSYDWVVGGGFSIGPQVDAIWTSLSGGYTEIDILAAIKYWF